MNWLTEVRQGWRDGQERLRLAKRERADAEAALVLATVQRMGRAPAYELMRETGIASSGRFYAALARLEGSGRVESYRDAWTLDRPVRRVYRVKGER